MTEENVFLTHLAPGRIWDMEVILLEYFSKSFYELMSWTFLVKLICGEWHTSW